MAISEREIKHRDVPVAYLWQRWFIVIRQPTRSYPNDLDDPFGQVTIGPLVTPDLDPPPRDQQPFVPKRNNVPFGFTLTTVDRGGETRTWSAPLVFVQAQQHGHETFLVGAQNASSLYFPVHQILGRGQTLAVARPVKAGDTSVEVGHLVFDGEIDQANVTSRPFLKEMRAIVPSMRHLAPQAPAVDLVFATPYLDLGLPERALDATPLAGTPNAGEVILALKSLPAAVDFSNGSDRAGGFISPNLSVKAMSRALGAVGDPSALVDGKFDPDSFLAGAFPKLFGLFSLLDLLEKDQLLDAAPAFVSDALDAVTKLITEAQRLKAALDEAEERLSQEIANGAHAGAKAVAQRAKDELDAVIGPLKDHLDDLITAVQDLPDHPDDPELGARRRAGLSSATWTSC